MKLFVIRANVHVDDQTSDLDVWSVDLVEGSSLSEPLKNGWFWATWPDRVEFVFSFRGDEEAIERISGGNRPSVVGGTPRNRATRAVCRGARWK